jgi:5-methylcytosine-specific restriction endonuclease McrA
MALTYTAKKFQNNAMSKNRLSKIMHQRIRRMKRRGEIVVVFPVPCYYCKVEIKGWVGHTFDFKIPASKGGTPTPENLVSSCAQCNSNKRDFSEQQFMEYLATNKRGEEYLIKQELEKNLNSGNTIADIFRSGKLKKSK